MSIQKRLKEQCSGYGFSKEKRKLFMVFLLTISCFILYTVS
ncbi:hypothetical protein HMPREF9554_00699 [Treponema phagedenis F0421]|nr:hypothetical protein HMPREF9554_00699 [Treponema phagedenis F0421]